MNGIFKNAGIASIGRIIANLIGVFVVGILTRTLGPDGFGDYNAIFAYLFLFNVLADMGLYTILVREISRPGAQEADIAGKLFTLRFCLILTSVLLAVVIVWLLPYSSVVQKGVMIGALSIVFSSLVQVLMGVFQKHLRLGLVAIADIATRVVQFGGIIFLVSYGYSGVLPFVVVAVIAGAVQIWLVAWFARRLVPFTFSIDFDYWKRIMANAFPIAVSLLFVLLYFKIDTVMLSLMKTPYEVGVYSVGYKVLEIVIFFPAMYIGLVMPLLSKTAASRERFKKLFWRTFWVLVAGAIPTVAGLMLFAGTITNLLGGAGYEGAVDVLRILSLAVGIIFFGNLGGNAIIALDLQRKGMWIYGVGALFNIITNLLFIPRYGYLAAAWTTVATELIVTVWMFALIARSRAYTAVRP